MGRPSPALLLWLEVISVAGYDAFDDFFRDCPYGGRASPLPTPLRVPIAIATGMGRAVRGLLSLTLRLTLHFGISTALLLLVVFVAFGAGKDDLAALDPRPYMEAISKVDSSQGQNLMDMQRAMVGLVEKDAFEAGEDPSVSGLVDWLLVVVPGEQRPLYDALMPVLREYDAMLDDTERALARRTVDAMFADLESWLEMAERDAARYQTPYVD